MRRIVFLLVMTIIILGGCAGGPSVKAVKDKDYLEDSKMYFNYREYERAIENAWIVYKNDDDDKKREEALYLLNESAEEYALEINNDLYIKSDDEIRKKISMLRSKFGINIELEKVGYEYLVYYDKAFYYKLRSLNSKSDFIKKIELRHIARLSKFVSDPAYRYSQIITVTKKYWQIFHADPKSVYASSILLKIADLYFYLYEQGIYVKKELNLSQSSLDNYFQQARELYKRIKKEYPDTPAASSIAYVIDNAKLRSEPKTKTKVLERVKAGTLVKIIDRSEKKESISNMYAYWYKIKLISGLEGWIYGFYLRMNY